MWIGLRTGSWPVQATVHCGALKQTVQLPANTQRILPVERSLYDRRFARVPFWKKRLFVPIEVHAAVGNVWVTLLSSEQERNQYQLFGGDASAAASIGAVMDDAAGPYAQAYYLETRDYEGYELSSGTEVTPFHYEPLAAGPYALTFRAEALDEDTALVVDVRDPANGYRLQEPQTFQLESGSRALTVRFTKPFAPYQITVGIRCLRGKARLGRCDLRPDLPAILASLRSAPARSPAWATPLPPELPKVEPGRVDDVAYGNRVQLVDLRLPATIQPGGEPWQDFRCAMRITRFPFRHFTEYDVFLNLKNAQGAHCAAMLFPLYQAMSSEHALFPVPCPTPPDLAPGEYRVHMGIRNRRTGKVLRIHGAEDEKTLMIGTTRYQEEDPHAVR